MNTPPGQTICPRTPSTPRHGSNFKSPTSRRRKQPAPLKRDEDTSSQNTTSTLSPPPSSPIEAPSPRRSPRNMKRARFMVEDKEFKISTVEDDSDHERTSTRPTLVNAGGMGLSTPAKTPRKRKLPPADLTSTSKVLFKSTSTTASSSSKAVPRTPVKKDIFANFKTSTPARHVKRPSQIEVEDPENIEIFTDSDARRPKKDLDPESAFAVKPGRRTSARKRAERAERFNQMGEHAHRTDGMYYIFRGKKVFRTFDNLPNREERGIDGDEDGLNPADIKPRLLFPPASEEVEEEENVENEATQPDINDEEEAETDIDEAAPSQSSIVISSPPNLKFARRNVSRMTPESEDELFSRRIATATGPKKSKKRLSSKALFDDGEDGSFEISRGVLFSDDEAPTLKNGVKRELDLSLDTPPRSSKKKFRKSIF